MNYKRKNRVTKNKKKWEKKKQRKSHNTNEMSLGHCRRGTTVLGMPHMCMYTPYVYMIVPCKSSKSRDARKRRNAVDSY